MKSHTTTAFGLGAFHLFVMVGVPLAAAALFPDSLATEHPFFKFGLVLSIMIFLKALMAADVAERWGHLNFLFLLTLTALAAFGTLLGFDLLIRPEPAFIPVEYYYFGFGLSFVAAFFTAQTIKSEDDPGWLARSFAIISSVGVYGFYVWLVCAKAVGFEL